MVLPAIKHLHHVALWSAKERKTERKDADRGENDAWFRKEKKTLGKSKVADEDRGQYTRGKWTVESGDDAVTEAIQDKPEQRSSDSRVIV